jgi:hypothetical protein
MADVMQALQGAAAPDNSGPVDVRAALANAGSDNPQPAAAGPLPTAGDRFATGLGDMFYGLGRLAQHIAPENALNAIRRGIGFDEVSTKDFDNIVSNRETQYQAARQQAGETGIDWWRLGGNVANPINYIGGVAGAAATVPGRIAMGTAMGAGMGAAQASAESTVPGNYWYDTAKGFWLGALAGGVLTSAVETVAPALRWGLAKARGAFGADAGASAVTPAAADAVTKQALQSAGVDPASVDLNLLGGMRQDVQNALEHGADINPQMIVNRARAESLPAPVYLRSGQASGDSAQYAIEQNLRGVKGVGEPILNSETEQNTAFIKNLDMLGAKNAPSTVDFGNSYAPKIQQAWDTLDARKNALYAAVRNSQGQSAALDGVDVGSKIGQQLNNPQASFAYDLLPSNIQKTVESLTKGDFPLSVAQAQSLDKIWGSQARSSEGSVANAINQAREVLGNAAPTDALGEQAQQAYAAAKAAHAQQMSLINPKQLNGMPNPNFQPLMATVLNAPRAADGSSMAGDMLFAKSFLNAPPSVAQKNLQFLSQVDPGAPQQVGQTLMGEIKRQALNDASSERGTVSEAVLRHWSGSPVNSARLDALMPKPAVDTFHNLAATVEAAKLRPTASPVSTSNSGVPLLNAGIDYLKNSVAGQVVKRLPIVRDIAGGLEQAGDQTAAQAAMRPGVTLKSLLTSTPTQAARQATLSRLLVPGAAAAIGPPSAQGPQQGSE